MSENNSTSRIIAGHNMADTLVGLACRACGRRFIDIAGARESDIGSEGIAHTGALNRVEYEQIRAEVARIWQHTAAVASGAGIGGMAVGSEES